MRTHVRIVSTHTWHSHVNTYGYACVCTIYTCISMRTYTADVEYAQCVQYAQCVFVRTQGYGLSHGNITNVISKYDLKSSRGTLNSS